MRGEGSMVGLAKCLAVGVVLHSNNYPFLLLPRDVNGSRYLGSLSWFYFKNRKLWVKGQINNGIGGNVEADKYHRAKLRWDF